MVEFQTIVAEEIKYGNNNFVEIALKKVEGGDEFVSISKGFVDRMGNKRFRGGLGIQLEIANQVADKIKEIAKAGSSGKSSKPSKKPAKEEPVEEPEEESEEEE